MTALLISLAKYLWVIDFTLLCVFAVLTSKKRQISSSFMTLALIVMTSGIIVRYEPVVKSFVSPETSHYIFVLWTIGFVCFDSILIYFLFQFDKIIRLRNRPIERIFFIVLATLFMASIVDSQFNVLLFNTTGTSYKVWLITAYFLGPATIYGIAIYAIHQAHLAYKKSYSLIARMYLLALVVELHLQIMMFIELYAWETKRLEVIYKWGLLSITISTTIVIMIVACLAIIQFNSKKQREGLLWNL